MDVIAPEGLRSLAAVEAALGLVSSADALFDQRNLKHMNRLRRSVALQVDNGHQSYDQDLEGASPSAPWNPDRASSRLSSNIAECTRLHGSQVIVPRTPMNTRSMFFHGRDSICAVPLIISPR
jgi:hypothetical protein